MSAVSRHECASLRPLLVDGLSYAVSGKTILSGVDFAMERGEVRAVVGPNGAGKSTLVRCISGMARKTGGAVSLFGRDQATLSRREMAGRVCYMPQIQGDPPAFTVRDFVVMGRYAHSGFWRGPGLRDGDRADAAMELAGVARFADRPLPTLSGGERQMVAIAAGLAQEAKLLVLDEPATFLDPFHRDMLLDVIRKVNREQGVSLLIVTHDVNMAMRFTHRTLALREGRVAYDGQSAGLGREGVLREIYGIEFDLLSMGRPGAFLAVSRKYSSW